jgi:hypothetical protein
MDARDGLLLEQNPAVRQLAAVVRHADPLF